MKLFHVLVCLATASWLSLATAAEPIKDDSNQIAELRLKADRGDSKAQFDLGRSYEEGSGVSRDLKEAVKWYRKAAQHGHFMAKKSIARILELGRGGAERDETEAAHWYRILADQGDADSQVSLGSIYAEGRGVPKDEVEAAKWYRKAVENFLKAANLGGYLAENAQVNLGDLYAKGRGVPKDEPEAAKWYRKAADQGNRHAQNQLADMLIKGKGMSKDEAEGLKWKRRAGNQGDALDQYFLGEAFGEGRGVPKDEVEAVKWYRKAAEQGLELAQYQLGEIFTEGRGVPKNETEAYKWFLLASAQSSLLAKARVTALERVLPLGQRAEGQKLAREFRPKSFVTEESPASSDHADQTKPQSSGTGFFITGDGYFITNQHLTGEGATVRVQTTAGTIPSRVVKVDQANDLALLKAEGTFAALPVIASRGARLGATVATVGFPNIGLQGFAPKLAKGEIASLAGAQDDARHFQISAPIQPGNSGGALVDERGNVIGVVVAKLNQQAALATSGTLAENVNYAVKSSYLLSFLESVPAVAAQLKEPNTQSRPFEDVVKDVEQATVLVLVY